VSVLKKKKFKIYILVLIVITGLIIILFNDQGLFEYFSLKSEINSLNEKITKLEEENKRLYSEIDSLKNKIPAMIEKTAREKYGMMRKGEKEIQVKEK
jgi:cell division protein FtsL